MRQVPRKQIQIQGRWMSKLIWFIKKDFLKDRTFQLGLKG